MPTPKAPPQPVVTAEPTEAPPISPARQQLIAAVAIVGALTAVGSCGMIGHALRHALTLVAILTIAAAGFPDSRGALRRAGTLILFAALAIYLSTSASMIVSGLGVLVMLCGVMVAHPGGQSLLQPIGAGIFVMALYRLANESISSVWIGADWIGAMMARCGAVISGKPLQAGATFACVDALVLMLGFAIAWIALSPGPRLIRGLFVFIAVIAGQVLYLFLLATLNLESTVWLFYLPALAAIIHATIAVFILRWSRFDPIQPAPRRSLLIPIATALTSLALPAVVMLCAARNELKGKTIVFYEKGYFTWVMPQWGDYGRFSQGMYSLMPRFLECYGAKTIISPELSQADLDQADALVMLYPDKKWQEGQLDRIKSYVAKGGTLLLFGEHTIRDTQTDPNPARPRWPDEANARFNDVLDGSNMRVRFDSGVFAIGGWLESYQTISHPMTIGVRDDRNDLGVVIGASVDARWPVRPLIIGRFGHRDEGDEGNTARALLGDEKYNPGEKLGDVVLAAEQRIGDGRIILVGDTSMMSNGLQHGCYDSVSRMLAYAANRTQTPQEIPRQVAGVLLIAALLILIAMQPHALRIAACALLLAASISLCAAFSHERATLIPDGRLHDAKSSNLAYIDSSHMGMASLESWRPEGFMGLVLCWTRAGYQVMNLDELSQDRLDGAGVYICLGPTKPFSNDERELIRNWVSKGGIFICTAGWDRREASRELLADFGLHVGAKPGERDPEPLGHFKSPFIDLGTYKPHVRFWSAWPVISDKPDARTIAYGGNNKSMILLQKVGKGKVVLVGDTEFALNKNLEYENGQPFEGMRESADFWRWFIDTLRDVEKPWTPADPTTQPAAPTASAGSEVSR